MGNNSSKVVWVGLKQVPLAGLSVEVASTLKGLCEELGVSYSTARKRGDGKGGFELEGWFLKQCDVRRVKGRGNAGGPRSGGNLGANQSE